MAERRNLTPADACWLYSEWEKNHQTVSSFLTTDRLIDLEEYRHLVQTRLLDKYPVFKQKAVMSRNPLLMPHWEDDPDFDINNHIEVVDLAPPGDKAALEALISEQRAPLLDRERPLWKMYVIQGYEGNRTALHWRIQHAIADGWALVRLFVSMADEGENARPELVGPEDAKGGKPGVVERATAPFRKAAEVVTDTLSGASGVVAGAGLSLEPGAVLASGKDALDETLSIAMDPSRFIEFGASVPESLAEKVQQAAAKILAAAGSGVDKAMTRTSATVEAAKLAQRGVRDGIAFTFPPKPGLTILHGECSGVKRVVWIDPVPLAPVRQAGKAFDATINDTLLAALTNALRNYLLEKDALNVAELSTAMPVSLRRPDEPLPRDLGNKFGLIPVRLPVGIEDPVEQLKSIKAQIDEIKASTMPVVSFGLTSVAALTTPDVERLLHQMTQEHSIGVTTNVPGPRHEVYLCGARVMEMWGMGGMSAHMNLAFAIFTLNGELNFAAGSDVNITPDPERILHHFLAALATLQERAGVTPAAAG
jgi:NRPS condensation-like uncharacterized protein